MRQTLFITGTDTGVGKTVFTGLLAQHLRKRGVAVAAFKPVCSGGRADARALQAALGGGALTLEEINPWHFRAPIAPVLAARKEKKTVKLSEVLKYIRTWEKQFTITLVEGAGGLLSPLGEDFDSRDLMAALRAMPIVVAQNKLGMVNHVLLTLEALPKNLRAEEAIILVSPPKPDAATVSNAGLLGGYVARQKLFTLPWLGEAFDPAKALKDKRVRKILDDLIKV
jgi:dethiobiotin synthetase